MNKWAGQGARRSYKSVDEIMMYVPLLQTIQTLLEDSAISNEVISFTSRDYNTDNPTLS